MMARIARLTPAPDHCTGTTTPVSTTTFIRDNSGERALQLSETLTQYFIVLISLTSALAISRRCAI